MNSCSVDIHEEADVAVAISRVRKLLARAGIRTEDAFRVTTVVAELGRNIVKYAYRGELVVSIERVAGELRVRVVCSDDGPGIANMEAALSDGFTTGTSLGMGLPGVRRLMEDFSIESTVGVGTCVTCSRRVVQR